MIKRILFAPIEGVEISKRRRRNFGDSRKREKRKAGKGEERNPYESSDATRLHARISYVWANGRRTQS